MQCKMEGGRKRMVRGVEKRFRQIGLGINVVRSTEIETE